MRILLSICLRFFLKKFNRKITTIDHIDYLHPLNNPAVKDSFKSILSESYEKIRPNIHSYERGGPHDLSLFCAMQYLNENNIKGDVIELGVNDGIKIFQAIRNQQLFKYSDRHFFLYDTFCGMPKPGKNDHSLLKKNNSHELQKWKSLKNNNFIDWNYTSFEQVYKNMEGTSYDINKIHLIKGDILKTIPNNFHNKIALLRIDSDWEESHRHALFHLYDKVIKNGVIIFDDYGGYYGAKKAVDSFFKLKNKPLLLFTSAKEVVMIKT